MIRLFSFFSTCLALCAASLGATIHPNPSQWEVQAEYLYWLPSIDHTYFVIKAPEDGIFASGKKINNGFGFHSGFRVGGSVALCQGLEAQALYTRLAADAQKTVVGDFLWATVGAPSALVDFNGIAATASSRLNLLYHRVDGLFVQEIINCPINVYAKAGLQYAYMRFRENISYVSASGFTSANIKQKSRAWGVGPEFGLEANYTFYRLLCRCPGALTVIANATGSLLASSTQYDVNNNAVVSVPVTSAIDTDWNWRVIPCLHGRLGLDYTACFSCYSASLEIGYEFTSYLRAFTKEVYFANPVSGLGSELFYNFDVHGLYIAASVAF